MRYARNAKSPPAEGRRGGRADNTRTRARSTSSPATRSGRDSRRTSGGNHRTSVRSVTRLKGRGATQGHPDATGRLSGAIALAPRAHSARRETGRIGIVHAGAIDQQARAAARTPAAAKLPRNLGVRKDQSRRGDPRGRKHPGGPRDRLVTGFRDRGDRRAATVAIDPQAIRDAARVEDFAETTAARADPSAANVAGPVRRSAATGAGRGATIAAAGRAHRAGRSRRAVAGGRRDRVADVRQAGDRKVRSADA